MSDFQFDKKELLADAPMMAKPVAGALIDWINKKAFTKKFPLVQELMPLVDWDKLVKFVLVNFAKDQSKAAQLLVKLKAPDGKEKEGGK